MSTCSDSTKLHAESSKELKRLLKDITHSGSKSLCREELAAILKLTDTGDNYVDFAFKELKTHLKKQHAEVRYSTVQLYDELFVKYGTFREKVLEKLDKFFKYALGIKNQLPPPEAAAQMLISLAINVFNKWHSRYGYSLKLKNGYNLLKNVHNVDFSTCSFVDPKEKKIKEENQKRLLKINKERLKNYNRQMEELRPEIEASLTSLESCFELLLPSEDLGLLPSEDLKSGTPTNEESDLRLHGVVNSRDFKVEIQLQETIEIVEDEENGPILEAAKDSYKIVHNSFLPKVIAWIELMTIAEGDLDQKKNALHLKNRLQAAVSKYNSLRIIKRPPKEEYGGEEDEVSSDSDLEEVPLPKPSKRTVTREEIGFLSERLDFFKTQPKVGESSKIGKASSDAVQLSKSQTTEGSVEETKKKDRKAKLLEVAPKLPYDVDLYHWEDEKLPTPTLIPVNTEGGRFWGASLSEDIGEVAVPGGSESLRSRVIEFTGKFEPVTRSCRARLPSGKLCPRHDRHKCPLHGVIVDRDKEGFIVNPEDAEKVKKFKNTPGVPDWQDPKLLAEIKAATGIDLKMPTKGQRLKKSKHPGLTEIKPKVDSPESRISKKIFNKKAMKRVAAVLDKSDRKRFRDKFGDQFNYIHDTS